MGDGRGVVDGWLGFNMVVAGVAWRVGRAWGGGCNGPQTCREVDKYWCTFLTHVSALSLNLSHSHLIDIGGSELQYYEEKDRYLRQYLSYFTNLTNFPL